MKKIKFTLLILFVSCSASKTLINTSEKSFFPIEYGKEETFKYADSESYMKHIYLKTKKVFNDKKYSVRLTKYSWNKTDTSFYRSENNTIYYYDKKSNTESIQMPRKLKKGITWTSSDNIWKYKIINVNAKLKTPEKSYSGLLVIKATQLQNRDKKKLSEYLNYYKQNIGYVASVTNGNLMTYRIDK